MDNPATRAPGPSPATRNDSSAQRETGDRNVACGHDTFSGPGSQPSGPRFRCSAPGSGSGPVPVPEPEYPHLIPDCRDLRPKDVCPHPFIRFPSAAPLSRDSLLPPSPSPGPSSSPPIHLCTFAQELRSDLHLCTKCSPLSPCHLAHVPPRGSAAFWPPLPACQLANPPASRDLANRPTVQPVN
jgi:hypothetical protein